MNPKSGISLKERNRDSQRRHRLRPGIKEQDRARMRLLRNSPEYKLKEKLKTTATRNTEKGWKVYAISRVRHRAKNKGIECSIVPEDLDYPEFCPVLGLKLQSGSGVHSRILPNNYSIDRMDNSKGYVPGNVRVISVRANILKRDASVYELERVISYMKGEL